MVIPISLLQLGGFLIFIAEYARLPLIPPYLAPGNNIFIYGANFASAACGALNETFSRLVVDLQTQLQYFGDVENLYKQSLGSTKAEQLLSKAVYLFSCGSNEYTSHIPNIISFIEGKIVRNLQLWREERNTNL